MMRALFFLCLTAALASAQDSTDVALPWTGEAVLESWADGCHCRFSFAQTAGETEIVMAAEYDYRPLADKEGGFEETKAIYNAEGVELSRTTREGHVSEYEALLSSGTVTVGPEETRELAGQAWSCRAYTIKPPSGPVMKMWMSAELPGIVLRAEVSNASGQTVIELRSLRYGD